MQQKVLRPVDRIRVSSIHPGVIIAGTDRVAIDAVGVALLRSYGTMSDVVAGRIFEQEQISRAVELGIGAASSTEIRLFPLDKAAETVAGRSPGAAGRRKLNLNLPGMFFLTDVNTPA